MVNEPIVPCRACRGEGIQSGPRACHVCSGVGRRAAPHPLDTVIILIVRPPPRPGAAPLVVSVRVWAEGCLDRCRELAEVVAPGNEIVLATGYDPTWRIAVERPSVAPAKTRAARPRGRRAA